MKTITEKFDLVKLAVQSLQRWSLYLSFDTSDLREVQKAAPVLAQVEKALLLEGWILLSFDTEHEARTAFLGTVGDDGPTASNTYNGDCKVYALLLSDEGKLVTENT